jgi:hypothetical protein
VHVAKALVGWLISEAHEGQTGKVEGAFAEERQVSSESLSGSTWPKESVHVLAKLCQIHILESGSAIIAIASVELVASQNANLETTSTFHCSWHLDV